MSSYEQHLSRGLQSDIDDTPIQDGMLRFSVDEARIFLDLSGERVEFTDFIKGLTFSEIKALTNPLPKMYLTSDTHQFMMYHAGEWVVFGASGVDSSGQIVDQTYIKELEYNADGQLIKTYGNGEKKTVFSSTVITDRITALEEKIAELLEEIEIIKSTS